MDEQTNIEREVERLNEKCMSCQEEFLKEGFSFSPAMCRYCQTGAKLHELLEQSSNAEAKWGKLDWNSSKYGEYYKG